MASAQKGLLVQRLALNQQVTAKIAAVAVPRGSKNYPEAKKLVAENCIRPT